MHILLVRHGLAGKADPEAWPDDDMRPLTDKGRKAFKRAAKGLRAQDINPCLILSSPARRTRETADLLAKSMGEGKVRNFPEAHHSRSPAHALKALLDMRLPNAAVVVGHEPWLGEFLGLLIAGARATAPEFAKGGAALVRFPAGRPAFGKGVLVWLLTQDQLAALA